MFSFKSANAWCVSPFPLICFSNFPHIQALSLARPASGYPQEALGLYLYPNSTRWSSLISFCATSNGSTRSTTVKVFSATISAMSDNLSIAP
jgi:hypothetical protein